VKRKQRKLRVEDAVAAPDERLRLAYLTALRRLARRDHSEAELRRALAQAGFEEGQVGATLDRLRRERALDDARFAAAFARSRLAVAALGGRRIRADLHARGVPRETTERALHSALADVPEAEALDSAIRRLLPRGAQASPEKRIRRLWASLLRRGFAPDQVRRRLAVLRPAWRDMLDELAPDPASGGFDDD
jgi:regulatory protein